MGQMLRQHVICPSALTRASPVVLTKRKHGSVPKYVDYRQINAVNRKDSFPSSHTDINVSALTGQKWFFVIELASGYWQVEVSPGDRRKTVFTRPNGIRGFEIMSFGLANGPKNSHRPIQLTFSDWPQKHACLNWTI